jgi:putative Mn2+ efflux pump MntP
MTTPAKSDGPEMSTIKGRGAVEAGGSVTAQAGAEEKVKKVIVAVHGVGDQYNFATIQAVVNQFCRFHGKPAAVPLGRFHGEPRFSISPPFPEGTFDHLAFAEVYWAKVPRDVVSDKHTIEESKKWAGTLVERLRLDSQQPGRKKVFMDADYDRIALVVQEMIQTLAVLERLSFLAAQGGLFTFNLKELLENYLGDVQIVTEFDTSRKTILEAFNKTMEEISKLNADVYIIAHSEGTVVSLLGLLEAGRRDPPPAWLKQVRGFMTIGSPIDKHLILWPTLFGELPPSGGYQPENKIQWRNYYDMGDPIGFDLDRIRNWIDEKKWEKVFAFTQQDDFGFVRYPFPGKAHVDYWNDPDVFGHFIETVVKEPTKNPRQPPQTIGYKKVLSYVVPYVLVTTLILIGVYILYRGFDNAYEPDKPFDVQFAFCLVVATTLLVLGATLASRVLRLTRDLKVRILGALVASMLALLAVKIGERMGPGPAFITQPSNGQYLAVTAALIIVTLCIGAKWPSLGLKPLIVLGTVTIGAFVVTGLLKEPEKLGPIWPVFLALAAFLYLWWLAALILDLVLVWHVLVHNPARVRRSLAKMAGEPRKTAA